MKIYSDVLDRNALTLALAAIPGLGFERFETLPRPRARLKGWDILLHRAGSNRPFNSGQHGADGRGAASWDDWGWYLSALYEQDPGMKVASRYQNRGDFHARTEHVYRFTSHRPGWTPVLVHHPARPAHLRETPGFIPGQGGSATGPLNAR